MDMQPSRVVVQFNAAELGNELARALNAPLISTRIVRFADTECDVVLDQTFHHVRGKEVILVAQVGGAFAAWSINDFLLMLCFLASRIRAAGATSLRCLFPYFPYARQDIDAAHGGISSARIFSDFLKAAGVDEVITFDLHNPHLLGIVNLAITNIVCNDFWLEIIKNFMQQKAASSYVLVAPDSGAALRVQTLAARLGIDPCFIAKRRTDINYATAISLSGDVRGKYALILDDIIDTGRTAVGAAELVLHHGASGVSAFFTHAILSSASLAVMQPSPFEQVIVTDTLHRTTLGYEILSYESVIPFIVTQVMQMLRENSYKDKASQGIYEPAV